MTTATAAEPLPAILGTYKRQKPLLVRGAGAYVWDEEGRRYLDLVAGIAVVSLGHGDAGVRQAIEAQLATGLVHTSNLYRTGPGEALASWLVAHTFADSVFFCNSGAEANEGALKFARRWGRSTGHEGKVEIVALRGAFHGRLPGTLAATDRAAYRTPFEPLMGGVRIVERDLAALAEALDPARTAAVIVEPIQGEGGVRVLDPEFLRGVRTLTRERNVLLILDEIQCGLGRTGHFLAHEGVGVTPDILTVAKPIANGLPMGAILVSEAVARVMQPGDHGTTFGGGPLLAAVAHHVVRRLSDPALLAHELIGPRSYKNGDDTGRLIARKDLLGGLELGRTRLGLRVAMSAAQRDRILDDAAGDRIDALLCLVQAAWAVQHPHGGLPQRADPVEGWIATAAVAPPGG